MAEYVWDNAHLTIDSVDLSDHVRRLRLRYSAEPKDFTRMGHNTRIEKGGLKNWEVEVDFNQDHAAAEVDATLWGIVGTEVTIAIRPDTGAKSATNPEYGGDAHIREYVPLQGAVGDEAIASLMMGPASDLARTTT